MMIEVRRKKLEQFNKDLQYKSATQGCLMELQMLETKSTK